jgi:hypothetical protein
MTLPGARVGLALRVAGLLVLPMAALVAVGGVALADAITYSGSEIGTKADSASARVAPTSGSGARTVTSGSASATTTWDLASGALEIGFDHVTGGARGSLAYSWAEFTFTVDADTTYSLAGSYSFTDHSAGTANESVNFYLQLYDFTANEALFDDWHSEDSLDSGTFVLGTGDLLEGSLTGLLLAGHTYFVYGQAFVHNGGSDGTYPVFYGSGGFRLEIGDAQVTPEPTTLVLFGGGAAAGAAAAAWRRRRRAARFAPASRAVA